MHRVLFLVPGHKDEVEVVFDDFWIAARLHAAMVPFAIHTWSQNYAKALVTLCSILEGGCVKREVAALLVGLPMELGSAELRILAACHAEKVVTAGAPWPESSSSGS